jgi:hypothetical protein
MARSAQVSPDQPAPSMWLSSRWIDLTIGCGLWSTPLLVGAYASGAASSEAWGSVFYALALFCNYPHFMATIYRAYGSADRDAHRLFTVYLTGVLVLVGAAAHVMPQLIPWIFTAYIFWSPWHYTGQNFGILMMFLRRAGIPVDEADRPLIRTAFVASYVMLLVSFNEGPSGDPFVLSLGLPTGVAWPLEVAAGLVFLAASARTVIRWVSRGAFGAVVAPLTLLSTQALWFVAPTVLAWTSATAVPQTRYSTGILAVMHSVQYLWVTQYFARRDAPGLNRWRYAAALWLGGIALFVPVPWLASLGFQADFTSSVLIVTAIVNLHHFIIDGVVWKLRHARVARVLVETTEAPAIDADRAPSRATSPAVKRLAWATVTAALVSVALLDQVRYWLSAHSGDLGALDRAAAMNPFDDRVQMPRLRLLVQQGRRAEARALLDQMIERDTRPVDALVNRGVLAIGDGDRASAIADWTRALALDDRQPQVHLYLAEQLDGEGRAREAAVHYRRFLELVVEARDAAPPDPSLVVPVVLKFGDALDRDGHTEAARQQFELAVRMAAQTGLSSLETAAKERLASTRR